MTTDQTPKQKQIPNLDLPDELAKRFNAAINLIKPTTKPIILISHYDGDGLSAGAINCATLLRMNKQVQVKLKHNLDPNAEIFTELKDAADTVKIFSDMGSGSLAEIEALPNWSIILDHHSPKRDSEEPHIVHINTHLFGINGTYELSAATLSFLFSIQVSNKNWDLIPIALAGAIADKQQKNGFKGLNKILLDHAIQNELLKKQITLKLPEGTIKESLIRSTDPYILGISNNETGTNELLGRLSINPSMNTREIDMPSLQRLASIIILKLLSQKIPPEDASEFVTERYYSDQFKEDLEEFSHIINACGRMSRMGLGVVAALGDPDAYKAAQKLRMEYKQHIIDGLKRLELDGPKEMEYIQYFYESTPEFAGTFAGIGMMYFFNQTKPVIALTKTEDSIKISGRGTSRLVNQGLDLAKIFSEVTPELNGSGGGHQIAAGATIPIEAEQDFIRKVDMLVGNQLKKES